MVAGNIKGAKSPFNRRRGNLGDKRVYKEDIIKGRTSTPPALHPLKELEKVWKDRLVSLKAIGEILHVATRGTEGCLKVESVIGPEAIKQRKFQPPQVCGSVEYNAEVWVEEIRYAHQMWVEKVQAKKKLKQLPDLLLNATNAEGLFLQVHTPPVMKDGKPVFHCKHCKDPFALKDAIKKFL